MADGIPFHERQGELHCEDLPLADLARRFGTPLYVYSRQRVVERFASLRAAFGDRSHICYAVKANSNLRILRLFEELGSGFDLVSGGEFKRLQAAGVPTSRAVFAGVAKEPWEIREASAAGILFFNLESEHELVHLEAVAREQSRTIPVALRLNLDLDVDTHHYIATARRETKFGMDLGTAARVVGYVAASPYLELVGYHVQLGSMLRHVEPYLQAFAQVERFMDADPRHRTGVRFYDCGGGFAIRYGDDGEPELDVGALGRELLPRVEARGLTLVLEPGRFLIGDAGVLLTRVLASKGTGGSRFLLVDAAMTELIRPALYQAVHPLRPVRSASGDCFPQDVVGQVCESGDFLAKACLLPAMGAGDLLAVMACGAYGLSMASNYNSRCRPAEVLVHRHEVELIRRREDFAELWAQEVSL